MGHWLFVQAQQPLLNVASLHCIRVSVALVLAPSLPALEALAALGALEARLVGVHEEVLSQVRRPGERPGARGALEGPLAAVHDPLVRAQVGGVRHARAAVGALVALALLPVTRPARILSHESILLVIEICFSPELVLFANHYYESVLYFQTQHLTLMHH